MCGECRAEAAMQAGRTPQIEKDGLQCRLHILRLDINVI